MVRTSWWAAVAVLVAATGGCGDSMAPSPFSGTYVLEAIDGEGAPLVTLDHTFSNGERVVHTVQYDTVTFTSQTTARRSTASQSVRFDATGTPSSAQEASAVYAGSVEHVDGGVIVDWMAPGTGTQQRFEYRGRTLQWETQVGITCIEGCPGFRPAIFSYRRR